MNKQSAQSYESDVKAWRRWAVKLDDEMLATWLAKTVGPGSSKIDKAKKEALMDEACRRLRWGTKREG